MKSTYTLRSEEKLRNGLNNLNPRGEYVLYGNGVRDRSFKKSKRQVSSCKELLDIVAPHGESVRVEEVYEGHGDCSEIQLNIGHDSYRVLPLR